MQIPGPRTLDLSNQNLKVAGGEFPSICLSMKHPGYSDLVTPGKHIEKHNYEKWKEFTDDRTLITSKIKHSPIVYKPEKMFYLIDIISKLYPTFWENTYPC